MPLRLLCLPAFLFGLMNFALGQAVQTYEVVVLGATPDGVQAANTAAGLGRKTALVGTATAGPVQLVSGVAWLKDRQFRPDEDSSIVLDKSTVRMLRLVAPNGSQEAIEGQVFIDGTKAGELLNAFEGMNLVTKTENDLLMVAGDGPSRTPIHYSLLVADSLTNLLAPGPAMGSLALASGQSSLPLGHAAGAAAAISLKQGVPVPQVDIRQIQAQLLEDSVAILVLDDMPRDYGKAWAGAQLIALYNLQQAPHFEPDKVMPPRQFELWWPAIFPNRGAPGPIYQPANRRDAAETVGQFFRNTYLNPKPKTKPAPRKGRK